MSISAILPFGSNGLTFNFSATSHACINTSAIIRLNIRPAPKAGEPPVTGIPETGTVKAYHDWRGRHWI